MTTLQERLRNSIGEDDLQVCMDEAADRIDLLEAKLDQYRTEYFETLRERDALIVRLGEPTLLRRIQELLHDRYEYSHGSFCTKLDEILEESK